MRRAIGALASAAAALALAGGCHAPPAGARNAMAIANQGAVAIEGLWLRDCGGGADDYRPVAGTKIAPGEAIELPVRAGCFDMEVRTADGQVVGRQERLTMMAAGSWTIR